MSDNVLLKALPPAVDYLAYLTILEYNLTSDQLPVLHDILQDTTLTTNIGWDLVHLLLPLLPASKECLQDVARLGNPREVILKTTELLEGLDLDDDEEEDEEEEKSEAEEQPEGALAGEGTEGSQKSEHIARDTAIPRQEPEHAQTHPKHGNQSREPTSPPPPPVHPNPTNPDAKPPLLFTSSRPIREFTTLLDMLSVLHPRIKTAYPSRFLATTLPAILRPYSRLARFPAATCAVLKFLRVMSGMYRPVLPPRHSTASLSRLPAPDPEAQKEEVSAEETALQIRLLQSFLTHVLEDYINNLRPVDSVPGMAWASRFSEMSGLERAIPGRKLYSARFEDEPELRSRTTTINQINALARHLNLDPSDLLALISSPEPSSPPTSPSSDLPSLASDVPLSPTGSLYLYSACTFSAISSPTSTPLPPPLSTIPTHALLLSHHLPPSSPHPPFPPLLDALLFLGLSALSTSPPSPHPDSTSTFLPHLHHLTHLLTTTPSPPLRLQTHTLLSHLLHSHPSPPLRLAFILSTLQHSPYANLKACAVGWAKAEILSAAASGAVEAKEGKEAKQEESVFATPACIDALAPFLFADPTAGCALLCMGEIAALVEANLGFWLAGLNLWFLVCERGGLRERLGIREGAGRWGVGGWVRGLRGLVGGGKGGEREGGEGVEEVEAMLGLLGGVVEMVVEAMGRARVVVEGDVEV